MAKDKVVKFCTQVDYVMSWFKDDKPLLKGAWSRSRKPPFPSLSISLSFTPFSSLLLYIYSLLCRFFRFPSLAIPSPFPVFPFFCFPFFRCPHFSLPFFPCLFLPYILPFSISDLLSIHLSFLPFLPFSF